MIRFLTSQQYQIAHQKVSVKDKTNLIHDAIDRKQLLEITYLKSNGEKSHRKVMPLSAGQNSIVASTTKGMKAFCHKAGDERHFRIDRILDIKTIE